MLRIALTLIGIYVGFAAIIYFRQRSLIFFPTSAAHASRLTPWLAGGQTIGYCREAPNANTIWLMLHGNAGQAADRDYVLPCLSDQDSLYVVEYPGYGRRGGSPSRESMNQAASEAYQLLRSQNPSKPVCVLGESIGSGPACALARGKIPPDKIVLVVPFDSLAKLASSKFPILPIRLMLRDRWDNVDSLSSYAGPVEIFGAKGDEIIPVEHARALAKQTPTARFTEISGGHNDWAINNEVKIQR